MTTAILRTEDLKSFFYDALDSALLEHGPECNDDTKAYLLNLLVFFHRTENLFPDHRTRFFSPLAQYYGEAVEAPSRSQRADALRRLGDQALLVSGWFAHALEGRVTKLSYYLDMGSAAYSHLACDLGPAQRAGLAPVFAALGGQFRDFARALAAIGGDEATLAALSPVTRH